MISLEVFTTFMAWCLVVNIAFLLFSSVALMLLREKVTQIHSKMFGLSEDELAGAYFQYLAQYKIMVLVFNFAPYLALRIMS